MNRVRDLPKDAFDTAVGFHEAALRCATEDPLPDGGHCAPPAPWVTNAAFATELYLKALALKRGTSMSSVKKHKHHLAALFTNALEEDERKAVGARWSEGFFGGAYEHMIEALEVLANAFEKHRYQYEHEHLGVSLGGISALARACYLGARDIVPEWPVHPHLHQRLKLFGLSGVNFPRGRLPMPEPVPNARARIEQWL